MWSSIEEIVKPDTLEEAYKHSRKEGHALLGGGSYLTSLQPREVRTLIPIRHLLPQSVMDDGKQVHLGAGLTLQMLIDQSEGPCGDWPLAVLRSCSSKQIRNQRTLGGEIGQQRTNSELYVALYALDAQLEIVRGKIETVPLRTWEGDGIICTVIVPRIPLVLERLALLDSAPAFLIAAGVREKRWMCVSIGGRINGVTSMVLPHAMHADEIEKAVAEASDRLISDHYGSREYKQQVLGVMLKRMGERL
ncbi:MAG: FAD binding domain-containing protein [bacterium]